ncbi:uncharacterized protein I303_102687 [Kwoniella dejecticola CBS 10117]|uniref:Dynactin subunit 4 n=1 Tax=Kwoniella dejecticola CBS 10117 TaxID=1296121 RepID=A0A1A6A9G0_9TREE|nr:uncharacterized protein I303_02703 [Kwoniella dejecticola CBS 10117]OBR86691.1 hypothetical protein I303_02703 [Kwoniella dejecticola CBS 10117]
MSITYSCSHLDTPHAPLPPSYPSSSSSYHSLDKLYFCEECDSVRCDLCVATEIASYFCPNCLFDVPSANVRADRNRCARSCFSCPICETGLSITASDTSQKGTGSTSAQAGPPYTLVCSGCKWSSKEVGWQFEKPTGIALQLQKMNTQADLVQSEFDALKDHLDSYISLSTPTTSAPSSTRSTRNPSRHISHITHMAQKALHREVGGMVAYSVRNKRSATKDGQDVKVGWDELGEYEPKESWRKAGLERGSQEVDALREINASGSEGLARLEKRWAKSYDGSKMTRDSLPQRIPLQTKLTKRCPHPNCRHLLIQPDTKTVRMKIKMVAANYLPLVEIGRRRRRLPNSEIIESPDQMSSEDIERRRRERRRTRGGIPVREEDEPLNAPLKAGEVYSYQIALTNPLYDPIQIRLTQPHQTHKAPSPKFHLVIPTPHFTINALKDAWAYDEEDEEDDLVGVGSEAGFSEEGTAITSTTGTGTETATGSGQGTLSRKSRLSILSSGKNDRRAKDREGGVEKRGNVSKVNLELEILPEAKGQVEFDLEIRYTYRAEDLGTPTEKEGKTSSSEAKTKEEYKNFTFWVRVKVGHIS